ncbi:MULTISPECIES: DUF411 domain-containing protein [unclassified Salinicola]|uniref:DUF411 domain-containing protein n=1 Tax=unclassified Salinicola TaxID=2634022 RepID=UPI00094E91A6|nr:MULTISPECIES: DUF411 domain-containing protein [unclassified Salinicola]OLO06687.1 hypothetical protein BTW08_16185 [Salinicola sp. MH3R3-1]
MPRRTITLLLSATLTLSAQFANAALPDKAILYKSPSCGCCAAYGEYLEERGVEVEVIETTSLSDTKARLGVPHGLGSCHTLEMGGYIVEGHVPGVALSRLFTERPDVKGISLPGMPAGTPGMPGDQVQALTVHQFGNDETQLFMTLPTSAG